MKKVLISSLSIGLLFGVLFFLFSYSFWPFTTGTNVRAFLGTTFEMSIPEVQRKLNKKGAKLIDEYSLKKYHPDVKIGDFSYVTDVDFTNSIERNKKIESFYMSPLQLFESEVVAKFSFENKKLFSVVVIIKPFLDLLSNTSPADQVQKIVTQISASLQKSGYQLVNQSSFGRDTQLIFKNNYSTLVLNKDPLNRKFSLFITYDTRMNKQKDEIKNRESKAF